MKASKKKKQLFIIILGRPGSGKGTQADLLGKKFGFSHLSTGQLLRNRAKKKDFVGRTIKHIQGTGALVPTPLVFQIWSPYIERFFMKGKGRGIILDGSPRKLYEAYLLLELLEMYGWQKNVRVLNIAISPKEAMRRLLKRGRFDDDAPDVKNRLRVFNKEVVPVLKFLKKKGMLLHVNGEQTIEDVHKEVLKKLKI
ncbi:MAG: nucleoside monophosphate kinase [bacterium]|nr:nucleoside monophosphate kinase [bacterium]